MTFELAENISVPEGTHGNRLYRALRPFVIKDLYRVRVACLEHVYAAVIASADDPVAFLREFHHFHITLAIRYFERPCGGRSVNGIQIVSRGHVINDDILPSRTEIQVATGKPSVRAGDPTVQK
jgi:hypothetical protein